MNQTNGGERVQLPVRLGDHDRRQLKSALAGEGLTIQSYLSACALAYIEADQAQRQRVAQAINDGPPELAGARLTNLYAQPAPAEWTGNDREGME